MTRAQTKDRRTGRSAIVPIHALPFETMTHIFQLVLDTQVCYYDDDAPSQNISTKSPEILSHVCSRWRQIALGSGSLWSHIDLALLHSRSKFKQLLARSRAFADRAGSLPLNIHILGGRRQVPPRGADWNLDLKAFCASVATRIGTLELLMDDWYDRGYRSLLERYFTHSVPGILNKFVAMTCPSRGYHCSGFINVDEYGADSNNPPLRMSNQCLEDLLLPVKVMHLNDLFFPWTSKAYHGLVDLQLTLNSRFLSAEISQLELAGILAASPGLRLLRLGLKIIDIIPDNNLGPPVVLNDLEVLSVGPLSHAQQNAVFQMISPGSKLQKVTIRLNKETLKTLPPPPSDELARFMTHSSVAQLSIKYDRSIAFRWLPQLLRVMPSLKALSLTGLNLFPNYLDPLEYNPSGVGVDKLRPIGSQIDCLRLIGCRVITAELRRLTKMFPIQKLELEGCRDYPMDTRGLDLNELAEIFPDFEFMGGSKPTKANYWDEL